MLIDRIGLRGAFGLSLLPALCAISLIAAPAHAANDWLVRNEATNEIELVIMPIVTEQLFDTKLKFQWEVAKLPVEVSCEGLESSNSSLEAEGKTSATYLLKKCSVTAKESPLGCSVSEPISLKVKGQAFVHEGQMFELWTPTTGTELAKILFKGSECALPEENPVKGALVMGWCDNIELFQKEHLLEAAKASLFATGEHVISLKIGTASATFGGSVIKKLKNNPNPWKWMP